VPADEVEELADRRLVEAAAAASALASDAELPVRIAAVGRAMISAYAAGHKAIFMRTARPCPRSPLPTTCRA
jgi:hypothetical protein